MVDDEKWCDKCGEPIHNEPAPDGTPVWVDRTGGDVCCEDDGEHFPDAPSGDTTDYVDDLWESESRWEHRMLYGQDP